MKVAYNKHGSVYKCCKAKDCDKYGIGFLQLCAYHGGGKKCNHPGCKKSAISRFEFCVRHGGGFRCECGNLLIYKHRCDFVDSAEARNYLIQKNYNCVPPKPKRKNV